MRYSGLILVGAIMSLPAIAEDCTEPETPDFSADATTLDVESFGDHTEALNQYESEAADYRACLNVIISAREDGWLDALGAFNASATGQDDVYQSYNDLATEFSAVTEARAEELALEQRMASEAAVIEQIEALNAETRARAEAAASEQNADAEEETPASAN